MFHEARIKLTAWYLAIIMVISLSFSVVIYVGINRELARIDSVQRLRRNRADEISLLLRSNGLSVPPELQSLDVESVEDARTKVLTVLGLVNLSIFVLAGAGGYFLAERNLEPIAEMVARQKEFISNASHELRTPLTSLKTEIEVALRDRKLSVGDIKSLLKSNLEEVNRMQRLSNYLLKLNIYEAGGRLAMSKINLKDIALRAVGKRKIKTNLKKSVISGNEDALTELVTILTDNAIKYGQGKEIEVRTKANGILEVEDHGIGIAKEELPDIFERFFRSDKSRGTDGYGLGLAIAKQIADIHGAKISVSSELGRGTTFRLSFN